MRAIILFLYKSVIYKFTFGKLIGVQRAQISKLENNTTNATIDTILKVFSALKAKVSFNVEILENSIIIAG